ncbi:MAG: NAD kinase [Candidatus Bostrichicola ureolyticus]|nr:MAG: NAD kinase [Candidatus Bostrichicola ureolyticus]
MKIAVYGHSIDKKNINYIIKFLTYSYNNSISIYIEKNFYKILNSFKEFEKFKYLPIYISYKDIIKGFDFMFTFGGDGTILDSLIFVRDSGLPILGINTGHLGFLSTFSKDFFIKNLDLIFKKKLYSSIRNLLLLETSIKDINIFNIALNEIVLFRNNTVSMITIDTIIDDEFLTSYWADGLIISTPTGSTGYSLSCGGPIITPENQNFVITPIAPHNLFYRPLIIPNNKNIHLKIHSASNVYSISLDTRLYILNTNIELYIKKAPFNVKIIQKNKKIFYKTLREKLMWIGR